MIQLPVVSWRLSEWWCVVLLVGLCGGCVHTQGGVSSAADQAEIALVGDYLNGLPRFEAHFDQSGDYGGGGGLVWLDRPGHLRIDYAGPLGRVLVISGGRVTILDRSNGAITTQPLSRTPLGILLAPRITLSGAVTVTSCAAFASAVQITLLKTDQPTQGSLTLTLGEAPLRLEAVTVTDPYARNLTMTLTDLDTHAQLTPELFQPPAPTGM